MKLTELRYPTNSVIIKVDQVNEGDRVRKEYGNLDELAESIQQNGIMHPPVVDAEYNLIAGGRRYRAMRDILELEEIPVMLLEVLDAAHLAVLEAEENFRRKEQTWQERALSIAKVHNIYRTQALLGTATSYRKWTIVETGALLGLHYTNVDVSLRLARAVESGDREIIKCSNANEAVKLIIARKEKEALRLQAAMVTSKIETTNVTSSATLNAIKKATANESIVVPVSAGLSLSHIKGPTNDLDEIPGMSKGTLPLTQIALSKMVHKGKMEDILPQFEADYFDQVITDIPYGIDMDMLAQQNNGISGIDDVANEHQVEGNKELFAKMFPAVYSVLKPGGFFVFFYDLDHHNLLQELAKKSGFSIQRWPLVWHKTSSCINQAAYKNFTKDYEVAMVCRKGNATMLVPQGSSVFSCPNDQDLKSTLGHPFVKPAKVWQWIYNAIAMKGQKVLDPFAGVGSSTIASIDYGLVPFAVECNDSHFDKLVINVSNKYKTINPNTQFS